MDVRGLEERHVPAKRGERDPEFAGEPGHVHLGRGPSGKQADDPVELTHVLEISELANVLGRQ